MANDDFDVFTAYNSKDKASVLLIVEELKKRGIRPWIDVEQIPPGQPILKIIQAAIPIVKSAAVFIGSDGLGRWQEVEVLSLMKQCVERKIPVIPVLLPGVSGIPKDLVFLQQFERIKFTGGLDDPDAIDSLVWGIRGEKPVGGGPTVKPDSSPVGGATQVEGKNPYQPWTPAQPPKFVGRKGILRDLENALETKHSVSMVGDSRIGKTSILRTWKTLLEKQGREVRLVSGEEDDGTSVGHLVKSITGRDSSDEPDPAAEVLSRWIASVERPGLPPVILIDEGDRIAREFPCRFFERMRGMLDRAFFVIVSRRELDEIFRERGVTSPFESRLQLKWIGLLDEDAAETIISWGESTFAGRGAELMRETAGRHPCFLQLLGYHLVDGHNKGADEQQILDEFLAEAYKRLEHIWQRLSPREKSTLKNTLSGIRPNLSSLRLRGLVTKSGELFGKVLEKWLTETQIP